MAQLKAFYKKATKAVHGGIAAGLPTLIICIQADLSFLLTALSTAAAVLGIGGTVYASKNTA